MTFTGDGCHPWAGGVAKPGLVAQGNLLTGPEVVEALVTAFEVHAGPFPERLLAGLLAAGAAGPAAAVLRRPRPEDVWPIEGELETRLLAVLRAAGRDPGAAWGEAGRTALRDVAGVENLEERLFDGDRGDRAVLEHLERRFG